MSTILTARYHRNRAPSDMTSTRGSHLSEGFISRVSHRHGVVLSDFDQSGQATPGEYFGEIPCSPTQKSSQVSIQLFLLSNRIFIGTISLIDLGE